MIVTPDATVIGGTSMSGISVPGSNFMGQSAKPSKQPLTIDLLSETLHPRLKFEGSPHYYWNKSGILEMSATDGWPLEYRGGNPIGRHAPEPAATNLQLFCRGLTASEYLVVSADMELLTDATGAPDAGPVGLIPLGCDSYLISQDIDNVTHVPKARYRLSADWQRLVFAVSTTKRSRIRLRYGQSYSGSTPAIWMTQGADYSNWLLAGDYAMSWFVRAGDGVTFPAGFAQIETGSVATSPIVTESGTAMRTAQTVTIDTTGYRTVLIRYSGSYGESFPATGNETTLHVSQPADWGTRYIQSIVLS